jgi:hypothetical protein
MDGIKWKGLEPSCRPDRLDCGFVRDPVGRSRMPRDDFHRCFVECNIKQIGCFSLAIPYVLASSKKILFTTPIGNR